MSMFFLAADSLFFTIMRQTSSAVAVSMASIPAVQTTVSILPFPGLNMLMNWRDFSQNSEPCVLVLLIRYSGLFIDFISVHNTVMKLIFIGGSLMIAWCMKMHRTVKRSYVGMLFDGTSFAILLGFLRGKLPTFSIWRPGLSQTLLLRHLIILMW